MSLQRTSTHRCHFLLLVLLVGAWTTAGCDRGSESEPSTEEVPVIEGVGGLITDWSGDALDMNSDGTVLAAANAELHRQALALLRA